MKWIVTLPSIIVSIDNISFKKSWIFTIQPPLIKNLNLTRSFTRHKSSMFALKKS